VVQAHEKMKSLPVLPALSVLCPEGCEWSLAVNVTACYAGAPETFRSFVSFIIAGNLWKIECLYLYFEIGNGNSQSSVCLAGEMGGIPHY